MAEFTPLDITSIQKKFERDGGLNNILVILVLITISVIGFIAYLLFSNA